MSLKTHSNGSLNNNGRFSILEYRLKILGLNCGIMFSYNVKAFYNYFHLKNSLISLYNIVTILYCLSQILIYLFQSRLLICIKSKQFFFSFKPRIPISLQIFLYSHSRKSFAGFWERTKCLRIIIMILLNVTYE